MKLPILSLALSLAALSPLAVHAQSAERQGADPDNQQPEVPIEGTDASAIS